MTTEPRSIEQRLAEAFSRHTPMLHGGPKNQYRWYVAYMNSPDKKTQISLHFSKDEAIDSAIDLLTRRIELIEVGPLLEFRGHIDARNIRKLYESRFPTKIHGV